MLICSMVNDVQSIIINKQLLYVVNTKLSSRVNVKWDVKTGCGKNDVPAKILQCA